MDPGPTSARGLLDALGKAFDLQFGSLEIRYQNGRVTSVLRHELLKPDEIDVPTDASPG